MYLMQSYNNYFKQRSVDLYGDIINQYVTFTMIHRKLLEESKSNGEDGRVIAKKIVEKCIEQNVLKDYMKSREVEVMDIMTTLFDQEYVTMVHEKHKIEDKIQEMLPELKKRAAEEARAEIREELKAEVREEAKAELKKEIKEKDDKIARLKARIAELTKDK